MMQRIASEMLSYALSIGLLELLGLVFGLLAVWLLIRQSILTWPLGILYVLVSFVVFWEGRLYGDLLLHVGFLILNVYGWYTWTLGKPTDKDKLPVSQCTLPLNLLLLVFSGLGIVGFGYLLAHVHVIWPCIEPASLPYWDAATSMLSITGTWLTAKKKIESWGYWFAVDLMASLIYGYKGIYFYSALYGVYIAMAVAGYWAWKQQRL